jgi:hypothetical protein
MATHRSVHDAVDVDVVDRVSDFLGDRSQLMSRQPSSSAICWLMLKGRARHGRPSFVKARADQMAHFAAAD